MRNGNCPIPRRRGQLWRRVLMLGLAMYILACLGCAAFQRRLIYFPPRFTAAQTAELARSARLEPWMGASGQRIGMKRRLTDHASKGQVLITYGNASCAVWCSHYADVIQEVAPVDVFIVEYPGYADRAGAPSQASLFEAADEALQSLDTNKPVFLLGESLGTGVAAHLAGKFPDRVAGVVLLAPFNRLADVAQYHMPLLPVRLMLLDRFPSQENLQDFHGPVAIVVGGQDNVVPAKFGRRLYESYSGPKRLWTVPDGNHETVMLLPASFWREIVEFWQANFEATSRTAIK